MIKHDRNGNLNGATFPRLADYTLTEDKRETKVIPDKFGDIQVVQMKDGVSQVHTYDKQEALLVAIALLKALEKSKTISFDVDK